MIKVGMIGRGEQTAVCLQFFQSATNIEWMGHWVGNDVASSSNTIDEQESVADFIATLDALCLFDTEHTLEICITAFRMGKHVFLASVAQLTPEQFEWLLTNRKEAAVTLQIGNNSLFHPAFLALKDEKMKPLYIETIRYVTQDQHLPYYQFVANLVDDISMVLQLVKSDIKRIMANGMKMAGSQIDVLNIRLEFANGCTAVLLSNAILCEQTTLLRCYQEGKLASVELQSGVLELQTIDKSIDNQWIKNRLSFTSVEPMDHRLQHFIACIQHQEKPQVALREGLEQLEIAHKILKKINSFNEV